MNKYYPYIALIIVVLVSIIIFSSYNAKYEASINRYNRVIDSIKYSNYSIEIENGNLIDSIKNINLLVLSYDSIIKHSSDSITTLNIRLDSVTSKITNNTFSEDSSILAKYLGSVLFKYRNNICITPMQLKKINFSIARNIILDSVVNTQTRLIEALNHNQILLTKSIILKNKIINNDSIILNNCINKSNHMVLIKNKEIRKLKRKIVVRTVVGSIIITVITALAVLAH